jgi:hypothetical protein
MSDEELLQNNDETEAFDEDGNLIDGGISAAIEREQAAASDAEQIQDFISRILESNLLKLPEVEASCKNFFNETSFMGVEPTLVAFIEFLITTRKLTEWQCELLREGQTQGFYFDKYEILNDLGSDEDSSTYLAQEVASNRRVKLRFTPILPFPFPIEKPQFEVEEL